MTTFVSPDDMMAAARATMLDDREPETKDDWTLIVNFLGANVARDMAEPVLIFMKALYNIPLPDDTIRAIADFQAERQP